MPELIDRDALMKKICDNECGSICDEECENVMCNYYDYIMDAPAVNLWIPCSERLPEEETDVIAVIDGCSREAFYSDSSFIGSNFYRNSEEVTYWMPKPEPPEKE